MLSFLGTKRQRSTAYHPQSNGLVECFYQHVKEAFRALQTGQWCDDLPIFLPTIRATTKEDLGHSPAELVFGEDLRLPAPPTPPPNEDIAIPGSSRLPLLPTTSQHTPLPTPLPPLVIPNEKLAIPRPSRPPIPPPPPVITALPRILTPQLSHCPTLPNS
ncbi:hypothetical protein Pmani_000627 [Petrolisthes manimaculis]|uniref:Integrase catalytic domain-containing protein n=1 Tax=Petrolisthes manimaculis TaxID=1843537 RepID=A0AAE1QM53_9EUCA|nr:hypothetical protein Pmani_000627 [Petrolisthes manimaculis]